MHYCIKCCFNKISLRSWAHVTYVKTVIVYISRAMVLFQYQYHCTQCGLYINAKLWFNDCNPRFSKSVIYCTGWMYIIQLLWWTGISTHLERICFHFLRATINTWYPWQCTQVLWEVTKACSFHTSRNTATSQHRKWESCRLRKPVTSRLTSRG